MPRIGLLSVFAENRWCHSSGQSFGSVAMVRILA
jgi:hypothetical protein